MSVSSNLVGSVKGIKESAKRSRVECIDAVETARTAGPKPSRAAAKVARISADDDIVAPLTMMPPTSAARLRNAVNTRRTRRELSPVSSRHVEFASHSPQRGSNAFMRDDDPARRNRQFTYDRPAALARKRVS